MQNYTLTKNLLNEYRRLDKQFNTNEDRSYEFLVNFSQTKDLPIYNWFYFVEGYSPELVSKLLDYLTLPSDKPFLLDPFSGSGTSLLVAKRKGIDSIGFEINPFSAFMISVKTRAYTQDEVEEVESFTFENQTFKNVYEKYELKIISKLFERKVLDEIESIKVSINKVKSKNVRDILYMCLLSILPDVSNYRKGGNGLKKKTIIQPIDTVSQFNSKRDRIISDLKNTYKTYNTGVIPKIINDSCLNASNYEIPELDISIYSPPYANCFDPFEVYKTELWIGEFTTSYEHLRYMRKRALTSNLNANLKKSLQSYHRGNLLTNILKYLETKELWDKRIPKMLDTYFSDMHQLLEFIYKKTKVGGYSVIVVGNSAYAGLAIPTDILLAEIGKSVGFKVEEIINARKNETSSQQQKKLGDFLEFMRESIIILKKYD